MTSCRTDLVYGKKAFFCQQFVAVGYGRIFLRCSQTFFIPISFHLLRRNTEKHAEYTFFILLWVFGTIKPSRTNLIAVSQFPFVSGVKRFSDRRIWPWIFVVNRADVPIFKTQGNVDQLWILARIPYRACLDVPKRNLDHRSFFSLGRYINELIQIISLFEQSSF